MRFFAEHSMNGVFSCFAIASHSGRETLEENIRIKSNFVSFYLSVFVKISLVGHDQHGKLVSILYSEHLQVTSWGEKRNVKHFNRWLILACLWNLKISSYDVLSDKEKTRRKPSPDLMYCSLMALNSSWPAVSKTEISQVLPLSKL